MYVETITRDLNKRKGWANQYEPIILRKGEKNETQVTVKVTNDGADYSMSGMTPTFCAVLSNGAFIKDTANVKISGSTVTYTVQDDLTSQDGDVAIAYIQLTSSNKVITTDNIPFVILRNNDLTTEAAGKYQSAIDNLTDQLEKALSRANSANTTADEALRKAAQALSDANTAKSKADTATQSANTAASSANTAAGKANTATDSANKAAKSANDAAARVDEAMESFKTIKTENVTFQIGDSGTTRPTGTWETSVKPVKGKWVWEKRETTYNQGNPLVTYTAVYVGMDGSFAGDAKIEALEEKVEKINNLTTGINLLRGTRDFRIGLNKLPNNANYAWDGFENIGGYEFYQDEDGFTVAKKYASGNSTGQWYGLSFSLISGFKKGDKLTISFEFMVDDVSAFDANYVMSISEQNNTLSTNITTEQFGVDSLSSKVWYQAKFVYTLRSDVTNEDPLFAGFRLQRNGSINFKKPMIQAGEINNPVYAPNPNDIVYINDETTGINLLRGTRDFVIGANQVEAANNNRNDGFVNSNQFSITTEDGFGVATKSGSGTYAMYNVSYAPRDLIGNEATVFCEVRLENSSTLSKSDNCLNIGYYGTSKDYHAIAQATLGTVFNGTLIDDVWMPAVLHAKLPSTNITEIMVGILKNSGAGSVSFRRVGLYKGHIEHPIWSASPLDVAQQTSLAALQTSWDTENTSKRRYSLPAGTDWNTLSENGQYVVNLTSNVDQTNYPTGCGKYGILTVLYNNTWRWQIYMDTAGGLYFRYSNNGWSKANMTDV